MLSPEEALQKLFDLVKPLGKETVTIANASGRILRDDCAAKHPQPENPSALALMGITKSSMSYTFFKSTFPNFFIGNLVVST